MDSIQRRVSTITKDPALASQLASIISSKSLDDTQATMVRDLLDPVKVKAEMGFLKALKEVVKYEGFDPAEMTALLLSKWQRTKTEIERDPEYREEVVGVVNVDGAEQEFRFDNDQTFSKDMMFICLMFITRGAAYDKIMKKSSANMKECMRILKMKYDINTAVRKPGQSLEASIITIPRIAATFPTTTVGLFDLGFGRTIFDINTLYPNYDIPRALLSPMIASVLPEGDDVPLAFCLSMAVKVDDILHQNTNRRTSLSSLYQYMMASYNSTATTVPMKVRFCTSWNLGKLERNEFKYKQGIRDLRALAKDVIANLRANDGDLIEILNKV